MTIHKKTHNKQYSRTHSKPRTSRTSARLLFPILRMLGFRMLAILVLGSILLAASCAPATPDGGNGDPTGLSDPSASIAVTGIVINKSSIDSTSFELQWIAPTDTGLGPDGTVFDPNEIIYYVYYLESTASTEPNTELITDQSIVEHPDSQVQTVIGLTNTRITRLKPNTRYYVTITSFNSFEKITTASNEVVEAITKDSSTAPGVTTDLAVDNTGVESTSFVLRWVAPTNTGTKPDGTALSPEEVGYRVYYLSETATQTGSSTGSGTEPSAESLRQNPDTQNQELTGFSEEVASARITGLEAETRYFVTITSYTPLMPQLETVSDEVVVATTSTATASFVGSLVYTPTEHQLIVGFAYTITPSSRPTIPSTDSSGASIRYELTRSTGMVFSREPAIANNGVITIGPISDTGTATYVVQALVPGYNTQEVTLSITVSKAENIFVSTYHSSVGEAADLFPVELGQAIEDDGVFALEDDAAIITIAGLMDESYTMYFGLVVSGGTNDFSGGSYQKTASNGVMTIPKSELATNSFSFADGAAIGISGSGFAGTQHVATYRPLNIHGSQDLQAMRKNLSGSYVLTRDIEFPSTSAGSTGTSASASNYEAVGSSAEPFTGSLDGAGNSIAGVQIDSPDNYQGLFGVMEASAVDTVLTQRLVLRDFKITGNALVGSLAGQVNRGTIDDVSVEVSFLNAGRVEVSSVVIIEGFLHGFGGGLLGRAGTGATDVQVRIQNTSSAAAVSGRETNSDYIGGLVGYGERDVTLTEGHATGSVAGRGDNIGGLVGSSKGTVSGSATESVIGNGALGSDNVGGLVGHNTGTVTGSATGSVTGSSIVGGLVGYNAGAVTGSATGSVIGDGNNIGGLVGHTYAGMVSGSATGDVTGVRNVGGLVGLNYRSAVSGSAIGSVRGTGENVGGLVGENSSGSASVGVAGYAIGYATGDVTGSSNNVGGLVGENYGSPVMGYATGSATGNSNVGGLVGRNDGGNATGYATGSATGDNVVGGLVGNNNNGGTVIGYVFGLVAGNSVVGGLIGQNDGGNVIGYARSVVRRRSGNFLFFGKTIGLQPRGSDSTYSSMSESKLYDGSTGTIEFVGGIGNGINDGTPVTVDASTTQSAFADFTFGTDLKKWTWAAGKWPAINIGDEIKPAAEQPVD